MSLLRARQKAEGLLDRLEMRAPPIDVHRIARELGLPVVAANLGEGVAGLLVSRGGVSVVCVQEGDPKLRQRFTIAHEIGHHYLGHQFERGAHVHVDHGHLISQRSPRSTDGADASEIEASQFAASLLMPWGMLRARIAEITRGPLLDVHVTQLAEEFQVSEQAMALRLATLDVL
jgi:Zn-dependent peptidase ImmA (M78 family)